MMPLSNMQPRVQDSVSDLVVQFPATPCDVEVSPIHFHTALIAPEYP